MDGADKQAEIGTTEGRRKGSSAPASGNASPPPIIPLADHASEAASEASGKPGRKRSSKATIERPAKRSLNLSVSIEDHERLNVHAIRYGMTVSDLVSKLARDHCREFHITRNPNAGTRESA